MTNWEKYFSTPEMAAMTLCDLEMESQFATRRHLLHDLERTDDSGKPLEAGRLLEDAAAYASTPFIVLFEWMGCDWPVKSEYSLKPTGSREFLDWLNSEADK